MNMFSLRRRKRAKSTSQALLKKDLAMGSRFCNSLQLAFSQCKPFCCHSKFHSAYNMVLTTRNHDAVNIFQKTKGKTRSSTPSRQKKTLFCLSFKMRLLYISVTNQSRYYQYDLALVKSQRHLQSLPERLGATKLQQILCLSRGGTKIIVW